MELSAQSEVELTKPITVYVYDEYTNVVAVQRAPYVCEINSRTPLVLAISDKHILNRPTTKLMSNKNYSMIFFEFCLCVFGLTQTVNV